MLYTWINRVEPIDETGNNFRYRGQIISWNREFGQYTLYYASASNSEGWYSSQGLSIDQAMESMLDTIDVDLGIGPESVDRVGDYWVCRGLKFKAGDGFLVSAQLELPGGSIEHHHIDDNDETLFKASLAGRVNLYLKQIAKTRNW